MNEDKTSYIIKDIDRDVWKRFKGRAYLNGFDTVAKCLKEFIKVYSTGRSFLNGTNNGKALTFKALDKGEQND